MACVLLLTTADHGPNVTTPETAARVLNCVEKRMRAVTPSGTAAASSGNGSSRARAGWIVS